MRFLLPILSICFSLYAVMFTFSNTEDGRKYAVYDFDLIAHEYTLASKNGSDNRALTHIFNRRHVIGGAKSLVVSLFNIDGYKSAHDDFNTFKNDYKLIQESKLI